MEKYLSVSSAAVVIGALRVKIKFHEYVEKDTGNSLSRFPKYMYIFCSNMTLTFSPTERIGNSAV